MIIIMCRRGVKFHPKTHIIIHHPYHPQIWPQSHHFREENMGTSTNWVYPQITTWIETMMITYENYPSFFGGNVFFCVSIGSAIPNFTTIPFQPSIHRVSLLLLYQHVIHSENPLITNSNPPMEKKTVIANNHPLKFMTQWFNMI